MKFDFIRFKNYRPFYGTEEAVFTIKDNTPSPYRKNIVLVGGLNGAGKTTLINAIYICLYGKRMFKDYQEVKANAINRRHFREGGRSSYIQLGFSDSDYESYIIEVKWRWRSSKDIEETRTIFQVPEFGDMRAITSTEEEFNDFIDRRLPKDVAPFFIFDAEKVRDLVGEHEKKETIDAIQKVVSLDLYKQLQTDLSHIKVQEERQLNKLVKDEEINKLVTEYDECDKKLTKLKQQYETLQQEIKQLEQEKQEVEIARRKKIVQNNLSKQKISKLLGEYEEKLNRTKQDIDTFGRRQLPYLIIFPLIKQLKVRINKEQNYLKAIENNKLAFASYDDFIEKLLKIKTYPELTNGQKSKLYKKGRTIWAELNHIKQVSIEENLEIRHDLSRGDLSKLLNWRLSELVDINKIVNKHQNLTNIINNLLAKLDEAPEEVDTKDEDDRLAELNQVIGSKKTIAKDCNKSISRLRDQRFQISQQLAEKRGKRQKMGPIEQKLVLLDKFVAATTEFVDKVTILKANNLKLEIEQILGRLFRKSDLAKIEFNPSDYTLRIFNEYGEKIDLKTRSEGEKQIISLAMIWALTKVSGAKFPFVIDTPLARLDSVHRTHMVNRFFTNLSEQVIILSTDTEIDEDFVEDIEPYLACSYLLAYDDETESTQIQEGYFNFDIE